MLQVRERLDGGFSDSDFGEWSWFVWVVAVKIFNEIIHRELGGQ